MGQTAHKVFTHITIQVAWVLDYIQRAIRVLLLTSSHLMLAFSKGSAPEYETLSGGFLKQVLFGPLVDVRLCSYYIYVNI